MLRVFLSKRGKEWQRGTATIVAPRHPPALRQEGRGVRTEGATLSLGKGGEKGLL